MKNHARGRAPLAVLTVVATLGGGGMLASPALAEQPVLVASQSGVSTCEVPGFGDNWSQAFPSGLGPGAIRRLTIMDAAGGGYIRASGYESDIESGLVAWYSDSEGIPAGGLDTWHLPTCTLGIRWSIDWFARPTVPVTFAGQGSSVTSESQLGFRAPGRGQYVADLTLLAGSVRVAGSPVVSSGTVPLGDLAAGDQALRVEATSPTPASWQVTIRALPVAISSAAGSPAAIRPGQPARVSYALSGDTQIDLQVLTESGAPVRELVPPRLARQGAQASVWDGRLLDGQRVPDGRYIVRITSADYAGQISSADVPVQVDGTAPTATLISRRVKPRQPIRARVADRQSGIASLRTTVGGRRASGRLTPSGLLVLTPPRRGWPNGRLRVRLLAQDDAGNKLSRTFSVKVR